MMHSTKVLYKRTATGAVQRWWAEIEGDQYRFCSGQVDGAVTKSAWTTAKPKNVGRANATTAEQQATAEVDSSFRKKVKEGYKETLEATADQQFSPMLAHDYDDRPQDVDAALQMRQPVFAQPKLDGIRCIARPSGLRSRRNTPIVAVPHVFDALREFFTVEPGVTLDGELYNHELRADFNKLAGLIRKTNITPEILEKTKIVYYVIYDVLGTTSTGVDLGAANYPVRANYIVDLVTAIADPAIQAIESTHCVSMEEINNEYEYVLGRGYEGQMLRLPGPYQANKRSPLLLKRKEFEDGEFIVTRIEEGDGNRAGMAGRIWIRLEDGSEQKSDIMGDRDFLRLLLKNAKAYIGKPATITYFKQRTPDGKLRFPKAKTFWPKGRDL